MIDHVDHIMHYPIMQDILQDAVVAADGYTYNRTVYEGKQLPSNGDNDDGRVQDQVAA